MNWNLETELRHGTTEWDILSEIILLMFIFEDGFECIDEVLQEIKGVIFRMPKELVELTQPDLSAQLVHALECYHVTIEEEEEVPWNINIPKLEGHCEVERPQTENPHVTEPLKIHKLNIRSDTEPKFAKIGDYWDEDTFHKVPKLLRKYQDLFPTNFSDLKVSQDIGA